MIDTARRRVTLKGEIFLFVLAPTIGILKGVSHELGIATYQPKALFNAYHHLTLNLNVIKGSVHNLKNEAGTPLYSDMFSSRQNGNRRST